MSGHRPFSELIKDFSNERLEGIKLGSARLKVKAKIAEAIGEDLLRANDELSDLLCEAELDFSDLELVASIEKQVAAVAGTEQDFTPTQLERIGKLTEEVRSWIASSESVKV